MSSIPFIPKVGTICVHTNNVINWNRIKKNPVQSSTEEILDCTKSLLRCWKKQQDEKKLQYAQNLFIECPKHVVTIKEDERDQLRVTAKIYLYSNDSTAAEDAINNALDSIRLRDIDTIIVQFPQSLLIEDGGLAINDVLSVWRVLERYVEENRIFRLGVADFTLPQLEKLCELVKIKPMINQIHMSSTCSVPEDLMEFAKDNEIQLLTHNDAPTILANNQLQSVISSQLSEQDGLLWQLRWVVRYSSIYKHRGVIRSKGYVFQADRDIKKCHS